MSFGWNFNASRFLEDIFSILRQVTISSFFFYIWYHFAYRKHGTLVLAISLSLFPAHIYGMRYILSESVYSVTFWQLVLDLVIGFWWCLLCFKLRAINLRLPKTIIPSSDPYVLAIRQATNLKELHSEYFNATRKDPFSKERYSEEYEIKRGALSESGLEQC